MEIKLPKELQDWILIDPESRRVQLVENYEGDGLEISYQVKMQMRLDNGENGRWLDTCFSAEKYDLTECFEQLIKVIAKDI